MQGNLTVPAAAGSAALLVGAFSFQLAGYAPCELCLWQRWPHAAAIAAGILAFALPSPVWPAAGALSALTSAGIGVYHAGVERNWWEGPASCSATTDIGELSAAQLLDRIMAAPVISCDEIVWQFAGLSMAGWNALISTALAGIWVAAALRGRRVKRRSP